MKMWPVTLTVLVVLSAGALVVAQERDAMQDGAKTLGRSAGSYAGQALARHVNIQRLTAELSQCGSCPQRADLERQLEALQLEDAAVKAMEGALLHSMGLKYDSFGSLLRAIIEDFTGGKYAERARVQDAYTSNMMFLQRPVSMWCYLHRDPREVGSCIGTYYTKWGKEIGEAVKSEPFARRLRFREIETHVACRNSLREIQRVAEPDPAQVRACEGELWEWSRLRNEVDAYCIANGATRTNWKGEIEAYHDRCRTVMQRQKLK